MRISMIGPVTPYRGGIAHFTTLLAKKLMGAGHEVQVISFKKQYPAWLYPGKSDKDYSPGRKKVDAQFLLTPINPFSWHKTLQAIIKFEPDQVLFPWWVTFWGPAFHYMIKRLKRSGLPISILIHNTMPHEAKPWDRFLVRQTLKHADRFIVMTEKEKNRLLTLLPNAAPIDLAPLPIYSLFKRTGLTKEEVRQSLGLPLDSKVLLFFGIIRPYKGLQVLIEAFKTVLENQLKAQLLIVGEFWEDKSHYLTRIEASGIKENVLIVDRYVPDDEVSAYFEAADLFVAPYIDGTQSAALKTALGYGLPVVATDVINDALIDGLPHLCKLVPAGNANALSQEIISTLNLPSQNRHETEALISKSWNNMLDVSGKSPLKNTQMHHD